MDFDVGQLTEHAGEADRALAGIGQGYPLPPPRMAAVALSPEDRVDLDLLGAEAQLDRQWQAQKVTRSWEPTSPTKASREWPKTMWKP